MTDAVLGTGLCSVTFRGLTIDAVARLAAECELDALEWGGDVHVPPGDARATRRAAGATAAADARCASYGSYLFASGWPDDAEIDRTLDTADALGASNVRIWTPFETPVAGDGTLADRVRDVAARAAARGLSVSLEFHGGTATGSVDGALRLLDDVGAPNVFSYWQPPYWSATDTRAELHDLARLAPRLSHLHVYEWTKDGTRLPLASGASRWRAVLRTVGDAYRVWSGPSYGFLEFVAGDEPDALRRDAAVLRSWLHQVSTVVEERPR